MPDLSPSSRRRRWLALTLVLLSVLLALVVIEAGLRAVGHHDVDGNFFIGFNRLKPYRLPLKRAEGFVKAANDPAAKMVHDPLLGWKQRPDGTNYSPAGMRLDPRAPVEPTPRPQDGVLRIALFGDSFTASLTSYPDSWGCQLQTNMQHRGVTNEVLNFGCGGYGMDQALLRWRVHGSNTHPHVVIFGFQPENLARNLNLIRPLYSYESSLPFTKPRFVLGQDSQLTLVNSPCLPLAELVPLLSRLGEWPAIQHEHYYVESDYTTPLWRHSKLITYLELKREIVRVRAELAGYCDPQSEAGKLGRAIIHAFAREVRSTGARFLILYLPPPRDLAAIAAGRELAHEQFLRGLTPDYEIIRPEKALVKTLEANSLKAITSDGHYSAKGDAAIGAFVAEYLEAHLKTGGK